MDSKARTERRLGWAKDSFKGWYARYIEVLRDNHPSLDIRLETLDGKTIREDQLEEAKTYMSEALDRIAKQEAILNA